MDSVQILTLYLTLTPIFSGRIAKINLHTRPKLTVVIPISCLLPCADPVIFVRGWGVHVNRAKKLWQRCLFVFFFCFFLSPQLIFWSQMVNFKEKYHFSSFRRGSKFVQGGGGGGFNYFQGGGGGVSNCLFPIETHITCDFQGGPDPLSPPSGSALGCDLFSFPVRKMMRSPLAPVLVFLQLRCMFSVEPRNKIVSWTYCMTVAWFIQHLTSLAIRLCFLKSLNKDSSISFCWGHFFSFPSHFDRWCFRHQCKRMTSYPMT